MSATVAAIFISTVLLAVFIAILFRYNNSIGVHSYLVTASFVDNDGQVQFIRGYLSNGSISSIDDLKNLEARFSRESGHKCLLVSVYKV